MKEQTRNTQDQKKKKIEEEIGKLSGKEFRIMIVKCFKNLKNRMEKIQIAINRIKIITKNI